jgi:hypothetical protein
MSVFEIWIVSPVKKPDSRNGSAAVCWMGVDPCAVVENVSTVAANLIVSPVCSSVIVSRLEFAGISRRGTESGLLSTTPFLDI